MEEIKNTLPKGIDTSKFVYIPDMPCQMTDKQQQSLLNWKEDAIQVKTTSTLDVR